MKRLFRALKNCLRRGSEKTEVEDSSEKQLLTPQGMEIVASVRSHPKKRTDFSQTTSSFEATSGDVVLFEACGHRGATSFVMNVWGNEGTYSLQKNQIEDSDEDRIVRVLSCPNCKFEQVKKTAIHCGLCGVGIIPGESVALYAPSSRGIKKEFATYVDRNVVGCLRTDCCPSGAFFAGHWTENGFMPAFGGLTVAEEVFRTGKPIFGSL